MKYARLFIILVVLLGGVYVLWQFSAPSVEVPAKPADAAPATPKPIAPAVIAPPKQAVAPPVVPPAVVAPASAVAAATPKPFDYQPQPDLKACIDQTIQLLEAKDVPSLVKTLMPPDAIQRMVASGQAASVDDIAAMYSARSDVDQQMTQLQGALETVKGQTPDMNADGTQATYKMDTPYTGVGSSNGNIVFVKVEGNWYLR
jgi:hypothetical protein